MTTWHKLNPPQTDWNVKNSDLTIGGNGWFIDGWFTPGWWGWFTPPTSWNDQNAIQDKWNPKTPGSTNWTKKTQPTSQWK
jgi:hypothetical protein